MQLRESAGGGHLKIHGCWMLRMNSHGVEISIAGCVEEIVREPKSHAFFFFFFFFLIMF